MTKDEKFQSLFDEAVEAGNKAGNAVNPTPMHLVDSPLFGKPNPDAKVYTVSEGVCGFAWVVIRPGNCAFANWLKKNDHARKHYYGGVSHYIGHFGQSMERKEAYAYAFADVLSDNGIKAHAESRMD